jgi:hypothetical protein
MIIESFRIGKVISEATSCNCASNWRAEGILMEPIFGSGVPKVDKMPFNCQQMQYLGRVIINVRALWTTMML